MTVQEPRKADVMGRITNGNSGRNFDAAPSAFPASKKTWDSLLNGGVIYTNDLYERGSPQSNSPVGGSKKPQRLEALSFNDPKKPKKKLY